jgi:hypothetical protein
MNYRKRHLRGVFALQCVLAIIFGVGSLLIGVLAVVDLTLGLAWGYTWPMIPVALAFGAVGYGWYGFIARLDRDLDRWPDK